MAWWTRSKEVAPTFNASDMDAAVIEALRLAGNESSDSIRQRISSMAGASGGYDFADTLHNIYADYGYPQLLEFSNFWNMYRRFGIAKSMVNMPPDTGWSEPPTIEGDDAFVNALDELQERIKLWPRLKGLDTRQRVGRYAGLFMRVKDGKEPQEPLEGVLPGDAALVSVTPLYESQLRVVDVDSNPQSERFGLPTMYEFRSGVEGDRDAKVNANFNIHPSRVIIAAEGADSDSVYGISALEAGYNSLMDLRKIIGGGGEGFYKNAAQPIVFKLEDANSASDAQFELLKKFNESYDEFARNRTRRALWTPGLEAQSLDSHLIQPQEFFAIALNDAAASVNIPATVLIGQQTGRLASNEDSRTYLSSVQSRRKNFMTDIVRDVLNWCVLNGILPASGYEVVWGDLLALSDTEKIDGAAKMATANRDQFNAGSGEVFTVEEIRDVAGMDPDDPLPPERDPDETLDNDEENDDGQN